MKLNLIHMFKGLRKEQRRIRWLPVEKLWPLTFIVLGTSLLFGIYFVGVDVLFTWLIKLLGIKN